MRARSIQNKENKRNLIIDTAIEVYLSQAGEVPSATEIAKKCNMSKGNLYTYFESKEELYFEILIEQYSLWFNKIHNLSSYDYRLDTRLFEDFYKNELLVKLCSLYHSSLKHSLKAKHKEKLENLVRVNLEKLTVPLAQSLSKNRSEIRILLYSSISLIIGASQFEDEYYDSFDYLRPEDIYIPRLKAMWSI